MIFFKNDFFYMNANRSSLFRNILAMLGTYQLRLLQFYLQQPHYIFKNSFQIYSPRNDRINEERA